MIKKLKLQKDQVYYQKKNATQKETDAAKAKLQVIKRLNGGK